MRELGPGVRLAGKYLVERVLGRGGMGVVVAARHEQLGVRVAIKTLVAEARSHTDLLARFEREARITAKLSSPHVVRVSDVGQDDHGTPYMVMELLEGEDLRQRLKRTGPLPVEQAIELLVQACEGLAEAHAQGVVHRDLKPANLFVTRGRDGAELVKVLDFGVARERGVVDSPDALALTAAGMMIGSLRYMAPEQLRDALNVDARADVWALGCVAYQLLTGVAPFVGEDEVAQMRWLVNGPPPKALRAHRAEVPAELEAAVLACLERRVERRTQDVSAFAAALSQSAGERAPVSVRLQAQRVERMLFDLRQTLPLDRSGAAPLSSRRSDEPPVGTQELAGPRSAPASSRSFGGLGPESAPTSLTALATAVPLSTQAPSRRVAWGPIGAFALAAPLFVGVGAALALRGQLPVLGGAHATNGAYALPSASVTSPPAAPTASPPVSAAAVAKVPSSSAANGSAAVSATADAPSVVAAVPSSSATGASNTRPRCCAVVRGSKTKLGGRIVRSRLD